MDLGELLLLVAFRRQIRTPDAAAGHARVEEVVGRPIDAADFAAAIRRLVYDDMIHDPVFLPAGALQCHWRLEPTPEGVAAVQALTQERGKSAEALIAGLSGS
ncbi:MAG TPA: hypothetical protein VH722_06850 [Alphaproteobacteria bacterium]|jgi:hypothetical protein|nr:hypothetical protein [Alphaproteobacteria bacterium]